MFIIESSLYNKSNNLQDLYSEIERCLARISEDLYNEKKYAIKGCRRYDFELLTELYEILLQKEYCNICFSDYPLSKIITLIRNITNKIPK